MAWNQTNSCEEMTTRQKIAVMQAFHNGKQIEFRSSRVGLYENREPIQYEWKVWAFRQEPNWNWFHFEYRVKE